MTTDAAHVLYPSAAPATEAPVSTTATDEPAQPAKTDAAVFYPKLYDAALLPGLTVLSDHGATPADVEEIRSALVDSFHAVALSPPEASDILHSLIKAHQDPASTEQRETWAIETRKALREQYGAAGAAERIRLAAAIVAKSPALRNALNTSGLGNRVDIVRLFAERAYRT